jgi:hypothetical protein
MNQDNDQIFAAKHPALHADLQRVLRPKPLSADFRMQVRSRLAVPPLEKLRRLLRVELSLRLANMVTAVFIAALTCWAVWPRLEAVATVATALLSQSPAVLLASVAAAGLLWLAAGETRLLG